MTADNPRPEDGAGGSWTSPSGDGDWQAPTYDASYPQAAPPTATPPAPAYQGWGPAWSPKPGVVPLRPLGLGELLDGGVKIIRKYPKPTLALSAIVSVVVTVVHIAVILIVNDTRVIKADGTSDTPFGRDLANGLPTQALDLFATAALTGALVVVVSRAVLGQAITAGEAVELAKKRFWSVLGVALLRLLVLAAPIAVVAGAVLLGGSIFGLLALPVVPLEVWLWTVTAVAPAVLVLEKTTPWKALQRSRELATRAFWRTFGGLALSWLIAFILSSILLIPLVLVFELPLFQGHDITLGPTFNVVSALYAAVIHTFLAPYTSGVFGLVYIDQRMRSEGLDVALQAAAATPAATSA